MVKVVITMRPVALVAPAAVQLMTIEVSGVCERQLRSSDRLFWCQGGSLRPCSGPGGPGARPRLDVACPHRTRECHAISRCGFCSECNIYHSPLYPGTSCTS